MSKTILIVTGSDYTDQVYQAFDDVRALGNQLYLLSDGSFQPTPGVFEQHFIYDLRRTQETLEYMKRQPVTFDAVTIKTSEWLTPLTALLAQHYGCIGNDPLTAFNCRSKYHMRQVLQKGGVPIPRFALCRNYQELVSGIQQVGLPCVAKPVGGNASYGTFLISNDADLKGLEAQYLRSIDYLKQKSIRDDVFAFSEAELTLLGVTEKVNMITDYLVEAFMDGPEISVDALVQNGKVTLMGIEDQIRMAPPFFLQMAAKLPYVCSAERYHMIESMIQKTIQAMGIVNSATHTEIIFTEQGPKIVEIGCRIGGDNLHDNIFQITGYNLMFEAIMIALGEKRNYNIQTKCHTAMQYLLPDRAGVLTAIDVPQTLRQNPAVTEIEISAHPGDRVGPPPQSFDFLGYLCVKGPTPQEAQKQLQQATSQIHFSIKPL